MQLTQLLSASHSGRLLVGATEAALHKTTNEMHCLLLRGFLISAQKQVQLNLLCVGRVEKSKINERNTKMVWLDKQTTFQFSCTTTYKQVLQNLAKGNGKPMSLDPSDTQLSCFSLAFLAA